MRSSRWLPALTLTAFAVQTDDFVVIGVLPGLAADLAVPPSAAGQLVTLYSLGYALTAPLWALLLARVPPRAVLTCSLAVFTAANLAVPLTEGLGPLLALRLLAALSAAVALPCALALTAAQAPPERRGRHLATVMTGLTGAVLLGVPLGAWAGGLFGWQAAFVLGGLLGAAALAASAATVPASGPVGERRGPVDLIRPLASRAVAAVLAATVLTVAGNIAFQTYLAVFLAGLAGVGPTALGALLVAAGVGGLVGTRVSGTLADRVGPGRAFAGAGAVFCAVMVAFALLWWLRPVPVAVVALLLVPWSAAAWAVPPALQTLMVARVGTRTAGRALAVHSSSVHVGAALGAVLGGAAVALGPGLVPAAAALAAALGLAAVPLVRRPRPLPHP
ncbi:MFS transporter [Nocardiopsis changdeensis]|uniref:MFS transporter n=1 Tax=Nocardiopsis changdeensis TaxID=2831969 RepID=A0ABX8BSM1_9ACTN|nr:MULTISPECIES: MFS transporter [Nocardiopsis]QUX25219.1 MFS transporter [Nocardiopsis changdeensis]QYX35606.1 MFS transporter [Nocardiopsis sp. MT53]